MTARQGAKIMLAAARDTEQSDSSKPSCCSPARQAVMHKRSACRCWPLAEAATHSGRQEHQASNQQQGKPHEATNQEKGMPLCSHTQVRLTHAHSAPMTQ